MGEIRKRITFHGRVQGVGSVSYTHLIDGKERTEDAMEKDMKKQIAEASRELLFEDQVKKLTVKAIVDKCKITRQAFYYHFEAVSYTHLVGLEAAIH